MTQNNNIPAGYKDSAVGIIPQEWEVKRLGLVCNFLDNQRVPIKDADRLGMHGPYPYYGASGIIDYVNDYIFDDELILLGEDGANIINRSTPLAFMVEGKIWVNNHAHVLRPIEPNNRFYICSYLESISYDKYNTGTAQPKLNREVCEKILIPVPPMGEQRKIAEILGVWDEAIEKQSRLIERLEVRKRALMQRLLTGRVRLPNFTTPWQKIKLGEIGKFDKGAGVPKDKITSSGCKAITYGEIYTKYNYAIKNFASYIDEGTARESKQISSGAILFAGSGETLEDIGKCVAFIDDDVAYAGGDIIIFKPKVEVDSLVLSYILNSPSAIKQKRKYGQGHSVVHIYQKDLAKIELELPSLSEQKAIAEVLTAADNEIATHYKKLSALRLQKRGLMQQLLTGKTRVKI